MVKELKIDAPTPKNQDWEKETLLWYEFVVEGVALPDSEKELLRDRYSFVPADRDSAAVAAEKQWDAYTLWAEGKLDERSPRERFAEYFKDAK